MQRSRLLSCRLTLRRRCSRPRSRRSSSSRALRMRGSSWFQSWPYLQALRFQAQHSWSAPRDLSKTQDHPGTPLTSVPSGPGPGPVHPSGSPETPAPPTGVAPGAAVQLFSATLRNQELKSRGCLPCPCSTSSFCCPISYLQWPAWPATRGSAVRTSAPSPAPRCCQRSMPG